MFTYFFIRFDRKPRKDVQEFILQYATSKPQFVTANGAITTIFHSDHDLLEIDEKLKSMEPSVRYFLIDISECDMELNFEDEKAIILCDYIGIRRDDIKIIGMEEMSNEQLNTLLSEAIESEDYESAALIRDELSDRQK